MPNQVDGTLRATIEQWAEELSGTVSAFLGKDCSFQVREVDKRIRVWESADERGIPLTINGETFLTLRVEYLCLWDSHSAFMAVDESKYEVWAGSGTNAEPLFRYNFLRSPGGSIPTSHLHVHAHRDAFTHVMSSAGRKSNRSKRLSKKKPGDPPRLSAIHFPLGGPRFRPCLEDLLESLQDEFGLDTGPRWKDALSQGRANWRRTQVRVVTRDAPEEAAQTLRMLGYTVDPPDSGHASESIVRLTEL